MTSERIGRRRGGWSVRNPAAVAVLALAALLPCASGAAPAYTMPIGFPGYSGAEAHTNFPALIVFSNHVNQSRFSYEQFASVAGGDLRFMDAGQTQELPYDVELWDTGGVSYVWVQVPVLTNGASIWAMWGDPDGTNTAAGMTNGAAWDANHKLVWHLAEASGTTVRDATRNALNGTASAGVTVNAAGAVGRGHAFNGSTGVDRKTGTGLGSASGPVTISYWARPASNGGGYKALFTTTSPSGNDYETGVSMDQGNASSTAFSVINQQGNGMGAESDLKTSTHAFDTWHHVVLVAAVGANGVQLYVDGVPEGSRTRTASGINLSDLRVGARFYSNTERSYLAGRMDEVRVETTGRSPSWVRAVYDNMAANLAFNRYGKVTGLATPDIEAPGATGITVNAAWIDGALVSTGGSATVVSAYWGATDAGATTNGWAGAIHFGTNLVGATPYSTRLSGLAFDTSYVYRYVAANAAGTVWSDATTFKTLGPRFAATLVGLNFGANEHAMAASESAGAVLASTNWNNLSGANGAASAMHDSAWGASGIDVTWSGFEGTYHARTVGTTGDESMMWGYTDNYNNTGSGTIAVSNIVADTFDVYAYFGSDIDNRQGFIGIAGASTYSYQTWSARAFPANYQRTADTGTGYPPANYAVWSNLTGSAFNLVHSFGNNSCGVHGIQVVARTDVSRPLVNNTGATGITQNAAWLNGDLLRVGDMPATVRVYWGTNDAGATAIGWSGGVINLDTNATVPASYTAALTGLSKNRRYAYRMYATNALGEHWAPASTFVTGPFVVTNVLGVNFGSDYRAMAATDVAGAVVASSNWNNIATVNDTLTDLHFRDGMAAGLTLTRSGFEGTYRAHEAAVANGDRTMMVGYLDNHITGDGLASLTVAGIQADAYDVYAYVGSDNPHRRGTLGLAGNDTYSYETAAVNLAYPGAYIRGTDTRYGFPQASYVLWTNLTASSFTLNLAAMVDYANGLHGLQIVTRTLPHLPGAPAVMAGEATGITGHGATATGTLLSTGDTATVVWVYWGTSDAGQTRDGWSGVPIALGNANVPVPPGMPLSAPLTGLVGETIYTYRFLASNAVEEVWSKPAGFTTALAPGDYLHTMPIRFSGYDRPETLVNFPALILLSNGLNHGAFDYSQLASAQGYDLRFLSFDQTKVLNHETEQWNTGAVSTVWVQVPQLGSSNDFIWACWGNPAVAGQPAPFTTNGAAWDPAVYKGVWHLAETTGVARDSTRYRNDGELSGGVTRGVTGQIGPAYNFESDPESRVLIANSPSLSQTGPFSLMAWSHYNRGTYAFCGLIDRRQDNDGDYGLNMNLDGSWRFYGGSTMVHNSVMGAPIPQFAWFLTTGTYDGAARMLYRNTDLLQADVQAGPVSSRYPITFGRSIAVCCETGFPGTLDEVRVCATTLSAHYIWASYMTTASNALFTTYDIPTQNEPGGMLMSIY